MTSSESTKVLRLLVEETVTTKFKAIQSEMGKLQQRTDQTRGSIKDFFNQLSPVSIPTSWATAAGAAIAFVGAKSVQAADHLQGLENRASLIFGSSFPRMREEALQLGEAIGRSGSDLLGFEARLGGMASSVGLIGTPMEEMSQNLSHLAIDMASFNRVSDEEGFRALEMGLRGGYKALADMGIKMDDTMVKQYAVTKGWAKEGEELSESQMMLARYGYIMDNTNKIQGDASRNADNLSNGWKRMKGEVGDLYEVLGEPILGGVAGQLSGVNDMLASVVGSIRGTIQAWNELRNQFNLPSVGSMMGNGLLGAIPGGQTLKGLLDARAGMKSAAGNATPFGPQTAAQADYVRSSTDEMKKYMDALKGVGGGGGGKGAADKAKESLDKLKDSMNDLGKSYRDQGRDISREIKKLEDDHKEKMASIKDEIDGVREKMEELSRSYTKSMEDLDRATADSLNRQSDKLEKLKDEEADLMKQQEEFARKRESVYQQGGSYSVEMQEEEAKLAADLAAKRAEMLREGKGLGSVQGNVSADLLTLASDRAGKTDVEKDYEDRLRREKELNDERTKRSGQLQDEMQKLQQKQTIETEAYRNSRVQMEETRIAMQGFEADFTTAMTNINTVTEEVVSNLKTRLEEMRDSISQIDALVAARADVTGGGSVAERRNARLNDRPDSYLQERASGGYASGLTLVGEQGPEIVSLPSGSYVHNNQDSQKMMGGVTFNFPGMVIQKTADAYEVVKIVAREIQKAKLQAA